MAISHEEALDEHVEKLLTAEPQWASILTCVRQRMSHNGYDYLDDVVQYAAGSPKRYTLEDAYVVAQIGGAIFRSNIARITIQMPMEAQPDKDLQKLSESFEGRLAPFVVEMWGGAGDQDGLLSWVRPVIAYCPPFTPMNGDVGQEPLELVNFLIEPWQVPLEVGSTKSSRTWLHLLQENGVARWAYGSRDLNVYIVLEPISDHPIFNGRLYPNAQRLEPGVSFPSRDPNDHLECIP